MGIRKVWTFAFVCLNFGQLLMGGGDNRFPRHRTQLVIPMSGPFTTMEATNLPEWNQIRRMTELIKTDTGSLDLFHTTALIEAKYANESYFLDFVKKWRDRIPTLPVHFDPTADDGSSWVVLDDGYVRTISITFPRKTPRNGITIMKVTWEGSNVSDLNFQSGFVNTVPLRHYHRKLIHRRQGYRPKVE
jgi:hypothetical protein